MKSIAYFRNTSLALLFLLIGWKMGSGYVTYRNSIGYLTVANGLLTSEDRNSGVSTSSLKTIAYSSCVDLKKANWLIRLLYKFINKTNQQNHQSDGAEFLEDIIKSTGYPSLWKDEHEIREFISKHNLNLKN